MDEEFDWDRLFNESTVKGDEPLSLPSYGSVGGFNEVPIIRHPYVPEGMIMVMSQDGRHIEVAYVGMHKEPETKRTWLGRLKSWLGRCRSRWQSFTLGN